MRRSGLAAAVLAVAWESAGLTADAPEKPKDVGLTERTSTRLAQIDVTVTGGKGAIEGLSAADFEVKLNDKLVPNLIVDDLCVARGTMGTAPAPPTEASAPPVPAPADAPPIAKPVVATYLLYFEMAHLTQSGRQGSISAAREMLPKLLAGGNRAMIVASAAELKTVVPMTADAAVLDVALAKMVNDISTFDPYAATEENRLAEVLREESRGVDFALQLARQYAAEERWRQERDLRRVSMVLGRLTDVDPPKAVLYFSDTMRQNAGEHYLSFFSGSTVADSNGVPTPAADAIQQDAATGALALDRVINEAGALGIRFYTVEGQGIGGPSSFIQSRGSPSSMGGGMGGNQAMPQINSQRIRDAQGTLLSVAAETGGRAFLNGVAPSKMASQILDDMSCLYLLSFDPKGFPQDKPLAVAVAVKRKGVKTAVRGRFVIQSDAERLTGRVLSAFASPESATTAASDALHVGVIPIAFQDGRFKARVQVSVPGSQVPITTWDIGASLVSKGAVRQDASGQIQVTRPNTPVIFEQDMEFAPGDYDLVAVAHETETDTLLSKEIHGAWPNLNAELATIGTISVSQHRAGGFLRGGQNQTQGAIVVGEDELLQADVPTAVITLVCHAKDQKRPLTVVRTLIGESSTPVGSTQLDLSADRCAQVVDLIRPKLLGPGRYQFVVSVKADGAELTHKERSLAVPEKAPPAAATPSSPSSRWK